MEIHAVDHDILIYAGDQQVAFAVEVVLRHNKQAVVFAGVKSAQGCSGKSARSAAAQYLSLLREIDVHQFLLVKCDITHLSCFSISFIIVFSVDFLYDLNYRITQQTNLQKYIFLMKQRNIFSIYFNRSEKQMLVKKNLEPADPGFCRILLFRKISAQP